MKNKMIEFIEKYDAEATKNELIEDLFDMFGVNDYERDSYIDCVNRYDGILRTYDGTPVKYSTIRFLVDQYKKD